MRKILTTILMVVLGIVIGAGGMMLASKTILASSSGDSANNAAKTEVKKDGPLVSIGEFTVNLQGGSFLKTSITLEGVNSKAEAVITAKSDFLKDRVNLVLGNKSLADVMTPAAREKLRSELLTQLNEITGNRVQQVLFITFMYQ